MSADTRIFFEPLSKVYCISAEQFKRRNILNPAFNMDVGLFNDPTLLSSQMLITLESTRELKLNCCGGRWW